MKIPRVMNRSRSRVRVWAGAGLSAAGGVLLALSRLFPAFAQWYGTTVYPVWVRVGGVLTGWFPYSLSEILLYLLLVGGIAAAAWMVFGGKPGGRAASGKKGVSVLVLIAGTLCFLYAANCGVNYQKESFAESAGIQAEAYTVDQLREVCVWLTEEVNRLADEVERDGQGLMVLPDEAQKQAVEAMKNLGGTYPELAGYYPVPKKLLNPWILAVQNLSGVYSPFTIEANYNSGMVDYNIPFTMCHELSHLKSFMQEEEANFIAYLACGFSEEKEFQYSGKLMGWIYCMNVLRSADYDAWEEVRGGLAQEIETDLQANHEYWARYDGAVAEVSNKVNDTYLKANGQGDGVKSYDRMVDLIVAYYLQGGN